MKIFETEAEKIQHGYQFTNESDRMTNQRMWISIVSGFFAGVLGGALGLGGAIILVPVWLNTGIDKDVAASSSPPLIFFSATIAFIMALLGGMY